MGDDRYIRASALAGAAAAGAIIVPAAAHASAYLPIPLAIALCDAWLPFSAACAAAFTIPFTGTMLRRLATGTPPDPK
eukprot:scaffold469_cov142-Isochrysis_galbana.AAC.6